MSEAMGIKLFAKFSAKYVTALSRISNGLFYYSGWMGELQPYPGIQIEPHETKGVWLVAANPAVIVWIHDEAGHASDKCVLDIDDDLIEACREHQLPEIFDSNKDAYPNTLPDWVLPDHVSILADLDESLPSSRFQTSPKCDGFCLVMVETKGIPPGVKNDEGVAGLYHAGHRMHGKSQTIKRPFVPFRDYATWSRTPTPTESVRIDSDYLSRLALISNPMDVRLHGSDGVVLIDYPSDPEIRAALMPCKGAEEGAWQP